MGEVHYGRGAISVVFLSRRVTILPGGERTWVKALIWRGLSRSYKRKELVKKSITGKVALVHP